MERYGLAGFEAGITEEPEVKYKRPWDKIEVGDIVLDEKGCMKRRTTWGWDADVNVK